MNRLLTMLLMSSLVVAFGLGCEDKSSSKAGYSSTIRRNTAGVTEQQGVNELNDAGLVPSWSVLVCTISKESSLDQEDDYFRKTFDVDYLKSIGGEANAKLEPDAEVTYKDAEGVEQTAKVEERSASQQGKLSSPWREELLGRKVTYAYCEIVTDEAQPAVFYFGSDDEAKIYVNGKLAHETYEKRACQPRQDEFEADLKAGNNSVLVKASQRSATWAFVLEAFPAE